MVARNLIQNFNHSWRTLIFQLAVLILYISGCHEQIPHQKASQISSISLQQKQNLRDEILE